MLWLLTACLAVAWLPAVLGHGAVARVSGLYRLGAAPRPYFQPSHFGLLYIVTPVIVASSFLLFLSPGGVLVLALGQARSAVEWVALSFGASLILTILLGTGAKLVAGPPLTWETLWPLWLLTTAAAGLLLARQVHRRVVSAWPMAGRPDVRRGLWMLGATLLGVAALAPKVFWEDFNLDGVEAFEFGRSLTTHLLPYWEIQNGLFGLYDNFVLFAYPNHWFISLFGPFEAAARLPYFLSLIVLFAALVGLIEHRQKRGLSGLEEAALWLGLILYSVVQVYNTNYEPFFADIAETPATDTLWMAVFLLAVYTLWTGRVRWFWIFGLMTYLASPGGSLLLAALAAGTYLARPANWPGHLRAVGGVLLVCGLLAVLDTVVYDRLIAGGVNDQFSAYNMLRRLYPPTLTEFVRLNALLFPSGILPALSLLVARNDPESRVVAGATLIYFAILYVQAWTALHQFTPVMLLPLIVFWRTYLKARLAAQRRLYPALAAATAVCIFVSLPRHFQINLALREFGQSTAYSIGDYERDYEQTLRGGWSLYALLPEDYRLLYPEQPWGADPASWIYYATREKPPGARLNYFVQDASNAAPAGATRVTTRQGIAVYVLDAEVWQRDRERDLPRVIQSPVYEPIYRHTFEFFRVWTEQAQPGGA